MRKIKGILLIILFAGLFSCSAQYHLNKAIKKDPGMFDTTQVVRIDTVQLPPLEKIVTEVELIPGRDTVIYVDRQGIQIRIIRRGNFATIECECPPPEMIVKTIETKVTVPLPLSQGDKWKIWWRKTRWLLLVAGALILGWKFKGHLLKLILPFT